jgi:hypothetical protein
MGAALRRFGGLRWKATTRSGTSGEGRPHARRFMRASVLKEYALATAEDGPRFALVPVPQRTQFLRHALSWRSARGGGAVTATGTLFAATADGELSTGSNCSKTDWVVEFTPASAPGVE